MYTGISFINLLALAFLSLATVSPVFAAPVPAFWPWSWNWGWSSVPAPNPPARPVTTTPARITTTSTTRIATTSTRITTTSTSTTTTSTTAAPTTVPTIAATTPAVAPVPTPVASTSGTCKNPIIRKEWRTLDKATQKAYLDAVQCILKKPAKTPASVARGAKNRMDDFVTTHILQFWDLHFTGRFLPWHRYYVWAYEKMLREECGYTGAHPYWDWTLDAAPLGSFTKSPMWDSVYGFGGNGAKINRGGAVPGTTGGGCVTNGPFKDMVVNMGPLTKLTGQPRCLARDFSPTFADKFSNINQVQKTLKTKDYLSFIKAVEGEMNFDKSGIHGGGHFSVGGNLGQMGDQYVSPSDPVFFLHHANLDRVWWTWQKQNLSKRKTEITGPLTFNDYSNRQGGNVALSTKIDLGYNAPSIQIKELMHLQEGLLCYDYDKLYTV